jgi:phage I-like protein
MMWSMTKKHLPTSNQLPVNTGIAICAFEIDSASADVRVVPAGNFRGRDGRPTECAAWNLTEKGAMAILEAYSHQKDKLLFDYNHQTLYVQKTGQKAPAAGWGEALEWRPGDGLYSIGTGWTPTAQQEIADKEFRYISPVITYNKTTGEVTGLLMASLVNYASLDGLHDLAAMAALQFLPPQESAMADDLMERLCYLLNLPLTTTPAEMNAELDKLKAMISAADGTTVGLSALLSAKDTEIAALSAQVGIETARIDMTPDPAKFVPISVVNELTSKLAALSGDTVDMQVEKLIADGVKTGRIIGDASKAWLTDMGKRDIAALQGYLDSAQPIAALSGMQTGGKAPAVADPTTATTEDAAKQKYQSTAALQAEFGDEATYLAYVAAEASGSVKILGGKN